MRIKHKLPLAAVVLTLFAVGTTAIAAITVAGKKAEEIYLEDLSAVADGRRNELNLYLRNLRLDLRSLATRPDTTDALKAFARGWEEIGPDAGEELRYRYIEDNPHDVGQKDLMDMAMEGDGYDFAHSRFHGRFRDHLKSRGYYDIFLFDAQGDLVYTVFKEIDYATNLLDGPYAGSGLGKAYRGAIEAPTSDAISFADFEAYAPSHGAAASFMAAPIFDGLEKIGVIAVQVPVDHIREILANTHGLGETGETILVNSEGVLVIDSPRTAEDDTLRTKVSSKVISDALAGAEAAGHMLGYRGIETVVDAVPMDFEDVRWGIAAIVDIDEVLGIAGDIRNNVLIVAGILMLVATAISLVFSRSLTWPINMLMKNMERLADGDTNIELCNHMRNDEIGDMARAVVVFRDAALENIRLEEEAVEGRRLTAEEARQRAEERARIQKEQETALSALSASLALLATGDLEHRLPEDLPETFRPMVANYNGAVDQLRRTMSDTRAIAETLNGIAESLTASSQSLAGRTEEQAASLTQTASSVQQLAGSIQSTADNSRSAMNMVGEAREEAENSRDVMKSAVAAMEDIDSSSQKITSIIGVIDEIAFQTNLLALNAGVEAARAGEAGKGFAVVATEVRELAQRCSTAANEVGQLISESARQVQSGVSHVAKTDKALDGIIARVGEITQVFSRIASATEEQGSSLKEVSVAVSSLDSITQDNSQMAELNSVEIEKLHEQVSGLTKRIKSFKTREAGSQAGAGARERRHETTPVRQAAA